VVVHHDGANRGAARNGARNFLISDSCTRANQPQHSHLEMGKHSRKRQKTEKSVHELVQPLGTRVSLTDDASKDDEERRLESLLFGVPFVPSRKNKHDILIISDEDGDVEELTQGRRELENMLDTDVSNTRDSSSSS
jgi:U3 small nucleolar RNA-associated protein 18